MLIFSWNSWNRKCLKNAKNHRKNHFEGIWTTHNYLKRQNLTKYGSNTFKMIFSIIFSVFQTFSVWITLIRAAPSPHDPCPVTRNLCPAFRTSRILSNFGVEKIEKMQNDPPTIKHKRVPSCIKLRSHLQSKKFDIYRPRKNWKKNLCLGWKIFFQVEHLSFLSVNFDILRSKVYKSIILF